MVTLLLDSSNTLLNVGFMKDGSLLCSTSYESWQSQSEHMIPEIDKLMDEYNITRHDIKGIIVAIGPGSYTGVRIALTIAKVMALALNIPIYPVSSLRVLKNGKIASICLINARSGRSYFAVYEGEKTIIEDTIKTNDEVLKYIEEHPDYCVCGDARYLGFENNDTNICLQMVTLAKYLKPVENDLGLKPIYMKD
ncbi:MAG: tRNA (adenosine(37)-N6)-threonylcarbamoyltransferase complex dimerization subunit type 1 TsaB [Bacilli bacterium]|nr:tRNA (adenosine(37)-N6)-threonylcarbamoyltransferase complex dimerization subunit type 1 TsaB [Bacilli bacterium]